MKKILLTFFTILHALLFSQGVPQGINYQAIIRNPNTNSVLTNTVVDLRFEIFEGSNPVYTETHPSLSTSVTGVVTCVIGEGVSTLGTFSTSINWQSNDIWYQVSLNLGSPPFVPIGPKQKFMSVPYALYALSSGNTSSTASSIWTKSLTTISTKTVTDNVSLGTDTTYSAKLTILQSSDSTGIHVQGKNVSARYAGIRSFVTGTTINNSTNPALTTIMGSYNRVINLGQGYAAGSVSEAHGVGNAIGALAIGSSPTSTAYVVGVFGTTKGNSNNRWAGYFQDGGVYIKDSLVLGNTTNVGNMGDVLTRSSTGRAIWKPVSNAWTVNSGTLISTTTPNSLVGIGTSAPNAFLDINNASSILYKGINLNMSNLSSSEDGLIVVQKGLGKAASFAINNSSSTTNGIYVYSNASAPTLYSENTGTSNVAKFFLNSTTNTNHAVVIQTIGRGNGIDVFHTGLSGSAGFFSISQSANSTDALHAETYGSGAAISAEAANNISTVCVLLKEGHLKAVSSQTPTITTYTYSGVTTHPDFALEPNSNDVKGVAKLINLIGSLTSGGFIEFDVAFNKQYGSTPTVVISALGNEELSYVLTEVDATHFRVKGINKTSGFINLSVLPQNVRISYIVIE